MLYAAGYRNAAPDDEWSYSFSGLAGSLDHVLLNGPARSRLTRADIWNVNSGESPAREYSTYKMTSTDLYAPDAKRPPITTRWWSAPPALTETGGRSRSPARDICRSSSR